MLWTKVNKAFWFSNLVIIESRILIRIGIKKMPVHNTATKNSLLLCHKRILELQEYNTDTLFLCSQLEKTPDRTVFVFKLDVSYFYIVYIFSWDGRHHSSSSNPVRYSDCYRHPVIGYQLCHYQTARSLKGTAQRQRRELQRQEK